MPGWNFSRQVSELNTDFIKILAYVDDFKKLDSVLKEFEVKDHSNE